MASIHEEIDLHFLVNASHKQLSKAAKPKLSQPTIMI